MSPNDWDRAKELFEAALELDPSLRASFLAENCHEASLQRQVEKLLTDYQAAGSFLDKPAFHSTDKTSEIEDPMVNRRLGSYKLVRRLGQGGMATVFLAVRADDAYQKEVAIKLVLPGLDSQDVMSRLTKERQTLASLDHPNIVSLLDGGSTPEGWPFLVMDYVEGLPIDHYCDQHKLSVDDRLRLFGRVCQAVQYAHKKLVIHRDLKPSNILVLPDGTPKLLDFGIAKVLNPEPGNQDLLATRTGLRCMTPAYASPEQARAKSVTTQSDVYSLGVVLYELLTGHRPYRLTQHSPAEIERAICEQEPETPSTAISRVENDTSPDGKPITKTPESVSLTREGEPDKLRRRLRGDLDNIVLKSLQKEPRYRYGSVAEFSQDIDRHLQHEPVMARPSTLAYRVSKFAQRHKAEVSAAFAVLIVVVVAASFAFNFGGFRKRFAGDSFHPIQSLAVIPFVNISGDPQQEYVSAGVTDGLIADLAQIGSLKVISRSSSLEYKETKKTVPEIAQELNVDAIVKGTVKRSGDHVRITANLVQAVANKRIWSKSYERDMRDLFILEQDVTEDIVRQFQSGQSAPEQRSLLQPKPVDPKVLEAYLQGNYHLSRYGAGSGQEEQQKAAELFQRAIDGDPNFAPAYVGLAKAHTELVLGSSEDVAVRKKSLEKAVEVDPNNSDAHAWLGWLKWQPFLDWQGAESEFRQAIALNPNNADAHSNLGLLLVTLGRTEEGLREGRIAQQLDPNTDEMSMTLFLARDFDGSIANLRIMLQKDPNNGQYHAFLSANYIEKHMRKEAVEELAQYFMLFGEPKVADDIRHAYEVAGYFGAIQQGANEIEHLQAAHRAFLPDLLAKAYTILGDKDRAFYWLEQAYAHREMSSADDGVYFLPAEPLYDSLRSDPRYKELLRRIGMPPSDAFDVRGQAVETSAPQMQSLVVLPLKNLSGDPAQEYFSDGMTDALITNLAQIGSLKVVSRTSSMRYKDTKKTLPEIARELNVDGILEGTVRRSGDRVHISAQLVYAASDEHRWAKSYERNVRDVFALERDVTEDIARQVQATLTTPNPQEPPQFRPINPKAFDAYLQGNFYLDGYAKGAGDEEKRKAAEYFRQAIEADPTFASAYNGLANAHLGLLWPSEQDAEIATEAAERAVALDPNSADARVILGSIKEHLWNWAGAEEEYRQAIALNPKSADAHGLLGSLLDNTGQLDDGWKEQQIAFQLDPNNAHLFVTTISGGLELRGQYDRAIAIYQMFLRRDPNAGYMHIGLARDYTRMGMYKEAMPHWEQFWSLFGFPDVWDEVHRALATSGNRGAMLESAKSLEHLMATHQGYGPVTTAEFYTAAGDKEQAFYWLEQAYSHRDLLAASTDDPVGYISGDPMLEPLRSEPRFKDLLRRMGLPELHVNEVQASGQLNGNN